MSDDDSNDFIKYDIFEHNGKFYTIQQLKFEVRERFMERVWYILNKIDKSEVSFNELIKLSIIWSNVKHLKCVYNDDIMKKI